MVYNYNIYFLNRNILLKMDKNYFIITNCN